jgi:hypothetical protein
LEVSSTVSALWKVTGSTMPASTSRSC